MRLYFITLSTIAVLLIFAAGGGIYSLSSTAIQQSKQQAMQATATGLATHLSAQITLLQQLINTLAQSPSVVAALSNADANELHETEAQLRQYVPNALKIRLILSKPPEQANQPTPDLSFADMEMVRTSFNGTSVPALHETGSNQHLAISAKVLKNNSSPPIGVILASIDFHPILQSVQTIIVEEGYFRIMQGDLQLMERGDIKLKETATEKISINNTAWYILSHAGTTMDAHLITFMATLVIGASLLMILFCYKAYRNFDTLFVGDRSMVLTAMKDLISHQMHQTYPINFKELKFMIETLYSLNQTYKRQPHPEAETKQEIDNAYLFTEETDDFYLGSTAIPVSSPAEIIADTRHNADLEEINLLATPNQAALDAIFNPGVIRGIVEKNLDNKMFYALGCAFGSELKTQALHNLVLGYDGRLSSQSFAGAFAQGVITSGINVLNIGQAPIAMVYFAASQIEDKTGAMITGGHGPAHINGLKLMLQGELAHDKHLQAMKQRIMTENFIADAPGNISMEARYNDDYLKAIAQDIVILKPLKVVVDCGNGVTSGFAPNLIKTLGCEVIELFCEVNGTFPNHLPDPSKSENMSDLTAAVVHYHADIGIAFDGDGDRLGVVDSGGKIIPPELVIQLFAKQILHTRPGASIIYNDKCSKQLGIYISQLGGKPIIFKKKQSLLASKTGEYQALFVGDTSGSMIFNDRWIGLDDALYAAARLLEILSTEISDSKIVFNTLTHDLHKLSEEAIPG